VKISRNFLDRRGTERGYVLIAILFMVTMMVIGLAAVLPAIRTQIKRDREEELIRRGRQYQRAIQLYYRRFGQYPASIEQLESTNNIRFLRKKYTDPVTGKNEWKLIRFGQQRARVRPAYLRGATPAGSVAGGSAGSGPATGAVGSGTGSPSEQPQGQTQAGVSNASDISRPLSGSGTMGGGPIVGVASTSEKDAVKELDGKSKYNEWEFVYDPTLDPNARQGANQGANQGTQPGTRGNRPGPASPQPGPPQPQERR
jgi:type II secretory pathway pseudopilin PulG